MRAVVLVLVLSLVAVACSGEDEGIAAGDCLDGPSLAEATETGCDEAHAFEVVGTPALDEADGADDADYPDPEAVAGAALSACAAAFAEHTGTPYEEADYDVTYALPSEDAWADDDRSLLCAATSLDGTPLEGPLSG